MNGQVCLSITLVKYDCWLSARHGSQTTQLGNEKAQQACKPSLIPLE